MSWNVSTRINNLQQQINNIANKGLTNPLEQILDANGYNIENITILDGKSNAVQIKTNNIAGIQTDCNLNVDGDITVSTLHYQQLDPPVTGKTVTYSTNGGMTQTSYANFELEGSNGTAFSEQNVSDPILTFAYSYNATGSSSAINIGFVTDTSQVLLTNGVLIYQNNTIYSVHNGSNTQSISFPIASNETVNFSLKCVNGVMKVFINNVYYPLLSETPMPDGNYYFWMSGYPATASINVKINNFQVNQFETLSEVLDNGNDAGSQTMQNLSGITLTNNSSYVNMNGGNVTNAGQIYCNTLNYTTLNPPVGGGGSQNIAQVLQTGNNALNYEIQNLGGINMTGDINTGGNNINDLQSLLIGTTGGVSHLNLGNTANNFDLYNDGSNNLIINQYVSNSLYNDPITIADKEFIVLKTNKLLYNQPNIGSTGSYVIDCKYTPPMYKQIINNASGTKTNFTNVSKSFFSFEFYDNSLYDSTQYRGVNYIEITFSLLILTFQVVSNQTEYWTKDDYCVIFVSDTLDGTFDNSRQNCIVVNMNVGNSNTIFTSSIPIILGCTCQNSNNNKLYLNAYFSRNPSVFGTGATGYSINMSPSNLLLGGYVSNNPNNTIQILT